MLDHPDILASIPRCIIIDLPGTLSQWGEYDSALCGVAVKNALRVLYKEEIPQLLVPSSFRTQTAEGLVAQKKNIYDLPFLNNGTMRKEYQLCFKHQNIRFTVELFRCQHCKSNQHNKKQRVPNMKNYESDKFSQSSSRWYVDEWAIVKISQLFLSYHSIAHNKFVPDYQ